MQLISPKQAEKVIRQMPNLIQEMLGYDCTPDQVVRMVKRRCKITADVIHQMNRQQKQNTGAKSGGGK